MATVATDILHIRFGQRQEIAAGQHDAALDAAKHPPGGEQSQSP
jgi:hypothetical protein